MNVVRRNTLLSLNAARIQTICEASSHGYRDLTLQYFEDALSTLVDLIEYDKHGVMVVPIDKSNSQQEIISVSNATLPEHAQSLLAPPTCLQSPQRSASQRSDAASSGTES